MVDQKNMYQDKPKESQGLAPESKVTAEPRKPVYHKAFGTESTACGIPYAKWFDRNFADYVTDNPEGVTCEDCEAAMIDDLVDNALPNTNEKPETVDVEIKPLKQGEHLFVTPVVDYTKLNIEQRLHAIQGKVEDMKKEGWNDFSKYQYLTAAQVVSKIKELMDEYRVIFTYSAELLRFEEVGKSQKGAVVRLTYAFVNIDNSKDMVKGTFDSFAGDTGDKQVFKAVTGGIKYIYTGTFNIANEDDPEKDKSGNKKVAPAVQNAEQIVGQIKVALNKLQPNMTTETEALALFRAKTGLNWKTFKGVTLEMAKRGQAALLSNMKK